MSKPNRIVEIFVTKPVSDKATYVKGHWKPIKFAQLKKGDIFRMWDVSKDGVKKADHLYGDAGHLYEDARHACIALENANATEGGVAAENFSVECVQVNHL